jgi:pilus assembly protein Flp/PilA
MGGNIMLKGIKNLIVEEQGQGMTEYGLVLGVVGIGAIVALVALKDEIASLLTNIKTKIFNNVPA